mgnify:CR=1 FL=1
MVQDRGRRRHPAHRGHRDRDECECTKTLHQTGLFSDRLGRLPVLYAGMSLFAVAATVAWCALLFTLSITVVPGLSI